MWMEPCPHRLSDLFWNDDTERLVPRSLALIHAAFVPQGGALPWGRKDQNLLMYIDC